MDPRKRSHQVAHQACRQSRHHCQLIHLAFLKTSILEKEVLVLLVSNIAYIFFEIRKGMVYLEEDFS